MNWQFLFASGAAANWILLTALHSVWLSATGLAIVQVRRFRAPAVRSAWCASIIFLLLSLPLITWIIPRPALRSHAIQAAQVATIPPDPEVDAPLLNDLLGMKPATPEPNAGQWRTWINGLGILWLVGTLGCLVRLLYGIAFLKGYCNCLREVVDGRLAGIVGEINHAFDFRRKPRFFVSLTIPSPVSTGISKPVVILPAALYQSAQDEELRAIIMHELAHIHHSDHVLGVLERLVKALYWWNPVVYCICDTLTTAREEVSDNYAISAMGSAAGYASLLVRLLEDAPQIRRLPCVAGMAAPYQCLQARIWNIVSQTRDLRVKAGKGMISAISATAVLMCGLIGLGSQVKIFGTEPASDSEKGKPMEAAIETRQPEFTVHSSSTVPPVPALPRNTAPIRVDAGQKTEAAITQTPAQVNVPIMRMANLARSDSFAAVRNDEAVAPQTSPFQVDEFNPPVIRSRVEPEMTLRASRARITATVSVVVIVNEKGEVYEARIRKGHPLLNQSAVNAVLQWKFEPLFVDGAPRAFVTTVDLPFRPE